MNATGSQDFRGKLLRNEPMARHTSWRLGGPADSYYVPADLDDLPNKTRAVHCDSQQDTSRAL